MDLIKMQLSESVFAGGGEMGARMRALDWSATALAWISHHNDAALSVIDRQGEG
jgi:hypothetical protein